MLGLAAEAHNLLRQYGAGQVWQFPLPLAVAAGSKQLMVAFTYCDNGNDCTTEWSALKMDKSAITVPISIAQQPAVVAAPVVVSQTQHQQAIPSVAPLGIISSAPAISPSPVILQQSQTQVVAPTVQPMLGVGQQQMPIVAAPTPALQQSQTQIATPAVQSTILPVGLGQHQLPIVSAPTPVLQQSQTQTAAASTALHPILSGVGVALQQPIVTSIPILHQSQTQTTISIAQPILTVGAGIGRVTQPIVSAAIPTAAAQAQNQIAAGVQRAPQQMMRFGQVGNQQQPVFAALSNEQLMNLPWNQAHQLLQGNIRD
jgi:hypothetical protein